MKSNDKPLPRKDYFGQNFGSDELRRAYILLVYLKDGHLFPKQIASRMHIKRQSLQYWIDKLVTNQLIYCTNPTARSFKQYKLTPGGQSFLSANEGTVKPTGKVTGENARFKCYIRNLENLQKFLQHPEYQFTQNNKELRNNIVYHGKIQGVDVTVRHAARVIEKVSLEMRSPQFSANTGNEAIYLMFNMMIRFQDYLDDKWKLDLTRLRLDSEHLELAWDSPYAQAVMTQTKGNPVKTPLFRINQSLPTLKPKEEWHNMDQLDKHIALPDVVDTLTKEVAELRTDMSQNDFKLNQLEQSIRSIAESASTIVANMKTTNQNTADLASKLTEFVNLFKSKNEQESGKIEPIPLNSSTKTIYG